MKTAALIAVTIASLVGAKAFAAAPAPAGSFGGYARPGRIEVNLTGGTMQQIACAPGAQPGATCYVAR